MTPTEALARALMDAGQHVDVDVVDLQAALAALGYEVRPIEDLAKRYGDRLVERLDTIEQAAEAADREAPDTENPGGSPDRGAEGASLLPSAAVAPLARAASHAVQAWHRVEWGQTAPSGLNDLHRAIGELTEALEQAAEAAPTKDVRAHWDIAGVGNQTE